MADHSTFQKLDLSLTHSIGLVCGVLVNLSLLNAQGPPLFYSRLSSFFPTSIPPPVCLPGCEPASNRLRATMGFDHRVRLLARYGIELTFNPVVAFLASWRLVLPDTSRRGMHTLNVKIIRWICLNCHSLLFALANATRNQWRKAVIDMKIISVLSSHSLNILAPYVKSNDSESVRYGSEPHVYLSRFPNITHVYRSWLTRDVKPLTFEYHIASFHPRGDINEW